ncbi:MAG: Stp1/IreP family PP2C-type Ser/Thr phosphatase [Candidatus Sericytochromatia bacterium]
MRAAGLTDIGKVRSINQDSYQLLEDRNIYIVADGMGGHAAGDQASRIAVKTITEILSAYDFSTEALSPEEDAESGMSIEELIRYALQEANEQILLASLSNQHLQGMGTTAIVSVAHRGSLYVGHIGDSRTYLIRGQHLSQITEDHSVVQQLVKAGAISEEEAQVHPYKNVITRCLGMQANVEPDTLELVLQAGDRVLMCSDGLSNMVSNQMMEQLVNEHAEPQQACDKLVALANQNGGTDNITVVLLYHD